MAPIVPVSVTNAKHDSLVYSEKKAALQLSTGNSNLRVSSVRKVARCSI